MDESKVRVKSLQKAMQVLNCFIEKQPLGVTEISEKLGLYKSNVHNILMTFVAMEYLEQDADSGKFRLGNSIFLLYRAMSEGYSTADIVYPYLQKLVKEVGETAYFSIPHEDEVLYLEAVYPSGLLNQSVAIQGWKVKMYCTGSGKAMMAFLDEDVIEEYIHQELPQITEYTITDPVELKKELKLIQQRGYALDNMELEIGTRCVAVPLFNRRGILEGAISVSGSALRLTDDKIMEYVDILNKYKNEICQKL